MSSSRKRSDLYWRKTQLSIANIVEGGRNAGISVLDQIAIEDKCSSVSHLSSDKECVEKYFINTDENSNQSIIPQLERFFRSRRLCDIATSPFLLGEVILKYAGAPFTHCYNYFWELFNKSREEEQKQKTGWTSASVGSAIGIGLFFILNAVIAQPLFYLGNVLAHARHFTDGVLNLIYCMVTANKKKAATCLEVIGKSFLNLVVDFAVGLVCYGLAAVCSVVPFLQPAVPVFTSLATPLHGSFVNIIVNFFTQPTKNIVKLVGSKSLSSGVGQSSATVVMQSLGCTLTNCLNSQLTTGVLRVKDGEERSVSVYAEGSKLLDDADTQSVTSQNNVGGWAYKME